MTRDERADDTSLLARARGIVDPRFLRFDPSHRDEGIAQVRALVESMLRQGDPLILVGDFNVTEREPAYVELTAGLRDAFMVAGSGNGNTWRPEWLTGLPLPLLRIDYMLCSPQVRPLCLRVDRALRGSDHCPVHGIFELDAKP